MAPCHAESNFPLVSLLNANEIIRTLEIQLDEYGGSGYGYFMVTWFKPR